MSAPVVATEAGSLRGVRLDALGAEAFLGMPFGAAPTGPRRWAVPTDVAPWRGVRDAVVPGPVCPQPARPFSEWAHGPLPATDEDSLALNVWRPATAPPSEGRPVLLFLHGGGWSLGWGSNALLDGARLAVALDAIVVVPNYRLGSLGWLYHPALAAGAPGSDAPAGNWGLADQLAALRWVADAAPAFGGDPARVTLGGESAGAGSVLHLLGRPDAAPLFTRALTLSPPLHELVVDAGLGERWTVALVAELGLGDDVAAALPALRALEADALVAAQERLLAGEFAGTRGGALPIVEPGSLPADPAAAPATRSEVPLLIGSNADEGTFFFRAGGRRLDPDPARLEAMVARIAHTDDPAATIAATRERVAGARGPGAGPGRAGSGGAGEGPSANDVLCAIATETWFAGPARRFAAARAAAGAEVHHYRIAHPSPDGDLGALHSLSVPLLFGSWREGGVARRLAGEGPATAAVTDALQSDVRRFVHGEPLEWAPVAATATDAAGADAELAVYGGARGPRSIVVE